jgi:hypothetical protein
MKLYHLTVFFVLAYNYCLGQHYEEDLWTAHYENGRIKAKGLSCITEPFVGFPRMAKPFGIWEYWYSNGNKMVEVMLDTSNQTSKYITCGFVTALRYIQTLLGHSSSKTTEIYTHVSERHIGLIVSLLDN